MGQFLTLYYQLKVKYPNDWWVGSFEERLENDNQIQEQFKSYDEALNCLDPVSKEVLEEKAIPVFKQTVEGRGKSQFFSLLNETLAYKHLIDSGYTRVRLIKESSKTKTPDISFLAGDLVGECEVKTIGKSEEELKRLNSGKSYSTGEIYGSLSDGFFRKIESTLETAQCQFQLKKSKKLVYLVLEFDDFTLQFLENYQNQILEFIRRKQYVVGIHMRVGAADLGEIIYESKYN